jgi:hypothetical protein
MKKKSKNFPMGAVVQWKWLGRVIRGSVEEIYLKPVSKIIKGKMIKRNGSEENPAYFVQSQAGNFALKLHSELQAGEPSKPKSTRPRMFG